MVGSQTDARQAADDLMTERPCCFPVCFNVECQGMAFTLAVTPESSSGTQGVGWGGTPAEPPDIIPSTDLAGCISAWDGAGKTAECPSWCRGNPHVLLSLIHFGITYPAQGSVLAMLPLLSRWLSESSFVNKGFTNELSWGTFPGKLWHPGLSKMP